MPAIIGVGAVRLKRGNYIILFKLFPLDWIGFFLAFLSSVHT